MRDKKIAHTQFHVLRILTVWGKNLTFSYLQKKNRKVPQDLHIEQMVAYLWAPILCRWNRSCTVLIRGWVEKRSGMRWCVDGRPFRVKVCVAVMASGARPRYMTTLMVMPHRLCELRTTYRHNKIIVKTTAALIIAYPSGNDSFLSHYNSV